MAESTTPSRLKRLSLVPGKPSSARRGGDSIDSTSSASTTGSAGSTSTSSASVILSVDKSVSSTGSATPTTEDTLSTSPLSPLALRSTRSPHLSRSSISYAPALLDVSRDVSRSKTSTPSPAMSRSDTRSPAGDSLTLAERHADLLRMIAMRERRVNELKQELATQEAALSSLRARWTSIARNDHTLPTAGGPTITRTVSNTSASAAGAAAPATTATPPVPEEPDELSLNNIWSAITQDADETIQEGKRFWGQLVKTVSAAAGGAVPEDKERKPLTSGRLTVKGRRGSSSSARSAGSSPSPSPSPSPSLRPERKGGSPTPTDNFGW